jgi:hypothetical protein
VSARVLKSDASYYENGTHDIYNGAEENWQFMQSWMKAEIDEQAFKNYAQQC